MYNTSGVIVELDPAKSSSESELTYNYKGNKR